MAFWFLLRRAAILTIFCAISYAEKDLLETLKPKRNDPPELVDFLESLLKLKNEFKEIREAAYNDHKKHPLTSSYHANNFIADSEDDSNMDEIDFSSKKLTSGDRLPKRRSRRRDSFRPINDVYPYMYEDDDRDDEMVPDEREERSSWKDVKERKHMYRKSKRDRIRQRRGLDLNDYNSDKDSELSNIKVLPRGRTGFRIVPGNKYEQRREVYPNYERKTARKRYNVPHKRGSFFWNGVPYSKRRSSKGRSIDHAMLGLTVDSESSADTPGKYKTELLSGQHVKNPGRQPISENTFHKKKVKASRKFGRKSSARRNKSISKKRAQRSMKLNIIDDNNLIQSIKQDQGTQSVVLTLRGGNSHKNEDNLHRKMHPMPQSHFLNQNTNNALNLGKTVQNKKSKSVAPSQPSKMKPEVLLLTDNPRYFSHVKKQQDKTPRSPEKPLVVYQIEAQEDRAEEADSVNIRPQKDKKTKLEDVDEPTSAIEQYDLSTKPYVISAATATNYKKLTAPLKSDADLSDVLDTSVNPNFNKFIVKESPDMVHGKHTNTFLIVEKRSADQPNPSHKNKLVTEKPDVSSDLKLQQDFKRIISNDDYDGTVNDLRNEYNTLNEVIGNHKPNLENQLIEELSDVKPERSDSNNNQVFNEENRQDNYDYQQEPVEVDDQKRFQSRRLQSFPDYDIVSDGLVRYGNLDYENGRNRRMKLPGYTENKIRVKRGLADLLGMSNDEDYAEDLAEEDSPMLKHERSDDTYDEEADSAVAEALAYDKKKNQQNKSDEKFAKSKTEDTEFTFVETFRKSTTEHSKILAMITNEIRRLSNAYATDFKTDTPAPNSHYNSHFTSDKANKQPVILNTTNIGSSSKNDLESQESSRNNNAKCRNCKNSKELQIGSGKCSCSSENKKCNCQHDQLLINKRQPKKFDETDGKYKTAKFYQVDIVKNYENGFMHHKNNRSNEKNDETNEHNKFKKIETLNNNDDSSKTVTRSKELNTTQNNTYHNKSNSICKDTLEPEKEDSNDDQINFNFKKLDSGSCNETSTNTSDQYVSSYNEKRIIPVIGPDDAYLEQTLALDTDFDENDSYAHHPKHKDKLDNKSCHSGKTKPTSEKHAVHYPKKYNQNKFKTIVDKSEREEVPELETVIIKQQVEQNTQNRLQRNADNDHPEVLVYPEELENSDDALKMGRESHKTNTQDDQDLLYESKVNENSNIIKYNRKESNESPDNQGQINTEEKDLHNTQTYEKRSVENNIIASTHNNSNLRAKKQTKLLLLDSVNSFDNIIEKNAKKKKINKRETSEYWNRIKSPKGQNIADGKYLETDVTNINMQPMERLPKFRNNYWKKQPLPKYEKVPYAPSHKKLYLSHHDEDFQKFSPHSTPLKYEENNPDQYEYSVRRQPLDYSNMANLQRFRRDRFSKDTTEKEIEQNIEEDPQKEEVKHTFPKQASRRSEKVKCKDKCKDEKMKDWVQPKGPKRPTKHPCFLDQEKNVVKPVMSSKGGSCSKDDSGSNKTPADYGQMHDAVNGHLASLIVQTIYKKLKQHKQLNDRFSHGLYRTHGFKSEMKDLSAFRNTETEGDIKHTEEMLHQIMAVLNKIILDQVHRRTCKHLSPEIQKYLSVIIKIGKCRDDKSDEESKISEEGFPLPLVVKDKKTKQKPVDTEQGDFLFNNPLNQSELSQDEAEIRRKMKMITTLLDKYKNMSSRCKVKFEDVESYLKKHLCLLKKMMKQLKKENKAEEMAKQRAHAATNKLKRKNYDVRNPQFNFHDFQPGRQDLINKQLESVGLGSSKTYTPAFNIDEMVQNSMNKLNSFKKSVRSLESAKQTSSNSKFENDDDSMEQFSDDYDNPKIDRKREAIDDNERTVSDKYRKLVEAAESFRTKRDVEERLGKLFGKAKKRSVKNEDDDAINSENSDFYNIGFESPKVFSLKK